MWNQGHSEPDVAYGTEPNQFLADSYRQFKTGTVWWKVRAEMRFLGRDKDVP